MNANSIPKETKTRPAMPAGTCLAVSNAVASVVVMCVYWGGVSVTVASTTGVAKRTDEFLDDRELDTREQPYTVGNDNSHKRCANACSSTNTQCGTA